MAEEVLIMDGIATNRIMLKVKLSAADFRVAQAETGADALARLSGQSHGQSLAQPHDTVPDAVVISSTPPDMSCGALILRLRALPGCAALPVLVLGAPAGRDTRLSLIEAGASDVLNTPVPDPLLIARLRAMTRPNRTEDDLGLKGSTAQALGFAEAQGQFEMRGRIAAPAPSSPQLDTLFLTLSRSAGHRFETFSMSHPGILRGLTVEPDVVIAPFASDELATKAPDAWLARLAEIKNAPLTRRARLLVLMSDSDAQLAATVLDMGADDVLPINSDPREVDLRLRALLRSKRAEDAQRACVRTGLRAAVTDQLTGLHNRRYAFSHLGHLIQQGHETGQDFAILLADLDHFKSVNDTYGHAAGDLVLTEVSHRLRAVLRPDDVLARIGGEEFMILLPMPAGRDLNQTAMALCQTVRDARITPPGAAAPITVTISVGATYVAAPCGREPLIADHLLAQADRALYAAKSGGRDMVALAQLSAA